MSSSIRQHALSWLVLLLHMVALHPACPNSGDAELDFIVVGSGAGGGPLAARLAESGFSILLVDAGRNVANVNTTLPAYNLRSLKDPQVELNYTLQNSPLVSKFNEMIVGMQMVVIFHPEANSEAPLRYPRAQALGGSTVHNAMINIIAGTKQDFDGTASMFNDPSWSRTNMQNYFRRIEHNLYLSPLLAPDHGFNGWLKTSAVPLDMFISNPLFVDPQLVAITAAIPLTAPPLLDLNAVAFDGSEGVNSPSATIDERHIRSSVHERLLAVQKSSAGRLQFAFDTLATKVLLCNTNQGTVAAYGVQLAAGAALPVASAFGGKLDSLNLRNATARYEVVVSAGAFQSPQLLMLSGIGDQDHLRQNGVKPVVNLPGVGLNLQDHIEVSVKWRMKLNYSIFDGCKFPSDPAEDPCLDYWNKHHHENIYALSSTLYAILTKSSTDIPVPDLLPYFIAASFPGFFKGAPQELADIHNALTAIVLKARPSSRGTVRLTGSHPQDRLDIQKFHFQAPGASQDLAAIRGAIRRARDIVTLSAIGVFVDAEVAPGANVTTDTELNDYIFEHVFGHHACCTNAIDNPNAVLDGDLKVRGVDNLRIVDASSWPNVPGFFITTPTYMMSEKAADVIIATTKQRK